MKLGLRLASLFSLAFLGAVHGKVLNDFNGNHWLDPMIGTGPGPRSFLIGNAVMPFPFESILNVRGDWMTNLTLGLRGEVFRTRSGWYTDANDAFGLASHWRMLRATGPNDNQRIEIGEITCNFGLTEDVFENRRFNVVAKRFGGSVWLRNRRGRPNYDAPVDEVDNDEALGNGLRVVDDSSSVGGGFPLNGYNRVPRLGYVGVGHTENMDEVASAGDMIMPWTRLHLVHGNGYPSYATETPEAAPYRPFCRNGTSISGNSTYAYIGHKYSMPTYPDNDDLETDSTDVLALWGNDRMLHGGSRWNNFSFRFTLAPDGTLGSASELEGLEIMRLRPRQVEEGARPEGFVGIGDYVNSYPEGPEERLDALDRTIRIRSMGPAGQYQNNGLNRVLVVDPTDGRVHWRDAARIGGGGGGADCDWTVDPTSPNHVWTATGAANASCPDALEFVGIGTSSPAFKLDVQHTRSTSGSIGGIRSEYLGSPTVSNFGLKVKVTPENGTNMASAEGVFSEVIGLSGAGNAVRGILTVNWAGANVSQASAVQGTMNITDGNATSLWGTRGSLVASAGTTSAAYGAAGSIAGYASSTFTNAYGFHGESKHYGTVTNSSYGGYASSLWFNGAAVTNSFGLVAASGPGTSVTATVDYSYGLYATARGGNLGNFSVYGMSPGTGVNDWYGYFPGNTLVAGVTYTPSDENLKTEIEPLANATDQIMQLDPKRYRYLTESYPQMGLPSGYRFGFLAQEVAEHFPDMVTQAHHPRQLDSLGQEISPSVDFMALSTTEMVPLLVAALKEQVAVIADLRGELDALQNDVAACCADGSRERNAVLGGQTATIENDLRIVPNPVADRTELRYTLATDGRVRLEITDATGRTMLVQDEGNRPAGSYAYEWNTTLLAPGTYHCALYVNDEFLMEKAVKLNNR